MAKPLKDIFFTKDFFLKLSLAIKGVSPRFNDKELIATIFDNKWDKLELKQRMRKASESLGRCLKGTYSDKINVLLKTATKFEGFDTMVFSDFVELFGLEDKELSLEALETFTCLASGEFAIRPFIVKHEEYTMKKMFEWSNHENHHLRRLASEGCRPRLPWAMSLPKYKKDPSFVLPILENLKEDESDYVKRSVANNLNDISKDHPELVLKIGKKWLGKNKNTDWIVKHSLRTLLKKGNTDALELFGFEKPLTIEIKKLSLPKESYQMGEDTIFSFQLANKANISCKLRVEYAIDYVKANETSSRKIFKITENNYNSGETYDFERKLSFSDLSTRKHYSGEHQLTIIINGEEKSSVFFQLE